MNSITDNYKCDFYFAAANGYKGFKCYFKEIFNPDEFEKIFIIKGGPGTGKSTLMKNIMSSLDEKVKAEAILCSSDVKSLDGVILEFSNKKIAIMDGTSPHATDPIYPGATEEIINLGNGWNYSLLKNNKENIEFLTKEKHFHYKCAYDYLKVCATVNDIIAQDIKNLMTNIKDMAESILENVKAVGTTKKRLISSFSKNGFTHLDTFEKHATKIYKAVGIYGSEYFLLNAVKSMAESRGLHYIFSPSPLSEINCDALYFPEERVSIIAGNRKDEASSIIIDTSKMLNQKLLSKTKTKLEFLWKEHESLLWSAADSFALASDAHFNLEKLYAASMDFSYNDTVCKNTLSTINSIFNIS